MYLPNKQPKNLFFSNKLFYLLLISWLASFSLNSLAASPIKVSQAKVRAVPPSAQVSAAFMQLTNSSQQAIQLVSASSPAAEVVELHTHTHHQGVMQMRQVAAIEIAANSTTSLEPGGLHLMLINLTQPLVEGQKVAIQLTFSDASQLNLEVPVEKITGAKGH